MRTLKQRKGQFIIIAVLMIAIMMVSIGAIMYSAVTYYRYERWEEYLVIVDNVKISSYHVLQISLANYTLTMNNTILRDNFNQWQNDIRDVYPGYGLILEFQLANASQSAYGENITYYLGLASNWFANTAFSAANATIALNITSVGLTGYEFVTQAFLRVKIFDATWDSSGYLDIHLTVEKEGPTPITNLEKSSFSLKVDDQDKNFTLTRYYDSTYSCFVYKLHSEPVPTQPSTVQVTVVDVRSIKVIANSTVT